MCFPMERAVEKKWEFEGLQCIVTRADLCSTERYSAHRCGYVRVPPNHPWHSVDYNDIDASVHGGLTFAQVEPCIHEDGVGYWIGFDCHHCDDASFPQGDPRLNDPKISSIARLFSGNHYWTLDEVQAETEMLAKQVLLHA
jgi:hypothetical protein